MSTKQSNRVDNIRSEFKKTVRKVTGRAERAPGTDALLHFFSEAQKSMDRKGWTRKRLAKEIGTSSIYQTQLFRGDRLLNFKTVAKIEAALEINFSISASRGTTIYQTDDERTYFLAVLPVHPDIKTRGEAGGQVGGKLGVKLKKSSSVIPKKMF